MSGGEVEVIKKKKKPARVQKDPSTVNEDDRPPQTGGVFNIWYLKWSGGDPEDDIYSQTKAEGRCNIERDSGYTKADKVRGSYFCLYFARGLCVNGKKCEYLHRLPTVADIFPPNVDCFGRDKFANYRDDMGGVGSFLRQNRTLYVGRIGSGENLDEVISRHFSEWGEIERTRVLSERGIAFVTYLNESNAQFAKEAMAHQSLDGDEVLNVRWATEDPNPLSKVREKRWLEEQAADAIKKILPKEFVDEIEGKDPEATKRRKIESGFGLQGYEAPDDIWYARGEGSVREKNGDEEQKQIEDANEQKQIEERDPSSAESSKDKSQTNDSLISSTALDTLKQISATPAPPQQPKSGGLAALADYDSDED
jgi:hypothetical protein